MISTEEDHKKYKNERKKYRNWIAKKSPWAGLPTASIGAAHELKVCADLILKGYLVFRAVQPHGKIDLIAVKQDKTLKIDVKTGYMMPSGHIAPSRKPPDGLIYAIFTCEGIYYYPKLA